MLKKIISLSEKLKRQHEAAIATKKAQDKYRSEVR